MKTNNIAVVAPTPDAAYVAEITGIFQPIPLNANNLSAAGLVAFSSGTALTVWYPAALAVSWLQQSNGTETMTLASGAGTTATIGGTVTIGDTVSLTATASGITGSPVTVSYTVVARDTLSTIAAGLERAVNANTNLTTAGIYAFVRAEVVYLFAPTALNCAWSFTSAGTETVTLTAMNAETITVGGSATAGDFLQVTLTAPGTSSTPGIVGSPVTVSYTVQTGNTLTTIAAGIVSALNSGATQTTYLTLNYPDLFLAASMIFVCAYLQNYGAMSDNPQEAQSWENQYKELLASAMLEEQRRRGQGAGWTAQLPAPIAKPDRT
jgi:hypothetical protein